ISPIVSAFSLRRTCFLPTTPGRSRLSRLFHAVLHDFALPLDRPSRSPSQFRGGTVKTKGRRNRRVRVAEEVTGVRRLTASAAPDTGRAPRCSCTYAARSEE